MARQGIRLGGSLKQIRILRCSEIERADIGDCDSMGIATNDFNLLTRIQLTRFDDREVEAAPATHQESLDHVVTIKSKSQLITRHSRLRDHENRRSDFQAVSDTKTALAYSFCSEILAEHAPGKWHVGQ